jgi:hypothetical protein
MESISDTYATAAGRTGEKERATVNPLAKRQNVVWGALLILLGLLALVQTFVNLSAWAWVFALGAAGTGMFAIYIADRTHWAALIPAYILWAVALLIALITLNILRDEAIAAFVLSAIALPFLVVFLRDRNQWWALIPTYVLLAVGSMVGLIGIGILRDEFIATYVLWAIALPFLVVFLSDTDQWWPLIPTYVLGAIGLMVGLIGVGLLRDLLIPAYVMFAIALPFFVVYVRDSKQWWALIPAGIMAAIGLSFFIAESAVSYVGPIVLIAAGVWVLARQVKSKEPSTEEQPIEVKASPTVSETTQDSDKPDPHE